MCVVIREAGGVLVVVGVVQQITSDCANVFDGGGRTEQRTNMRKLTHHPQSHITSP